MRFLIPVLSASFRPLGPSLEGSGRQFHARMPSKRAAKLLVARSHLQRPIIAESYFELKRKDHRACLLVCQRRGSEEARATGSRTPSRTAVSFFHHISSMVKAQLVSALARSAPGRRSCSGVTFLSSTRSDTPSACQTTTVTVLAARVSPVYSHRALCSRNAKLSSNRTTSSHCEPCALWTVRA